MFRRILLALATLVVLAPAARAETVDEVIAKHVQAQGGLEKMKAVKSVKMTGKTMLGQGVEAPFVRYTKRPDKMRLQFTFQGMTGIQAFDGKEAWSVMPFMGKTTPEIATAEESRRSAEQADMDGPLVDYQAKGNKVELAGKEAVEGADAYKLKVTLKNGEERTMFVDAETGLLVKISGKAMMRGSETEFETSMSDYREVKGMMMPFTIESGVTGMPQRQKAVVESVEVNVDLPDSLFAVPATAVRPAAKPDSLKAGEAKTAPAESPKPPAQEAKNKKDATKPATPKSGRGSQQ